MDPCSFRCGDEVVNNGLQILCEKVLLGRGEQFGLRRALGLLSYPDLAGREVTAAVEECADPGGGGDGGGRAAAGPGVRDRLKEVIREAIKRVG